jgi:hypothetical protein
MTAAELLPIVNLKLKDASIGEDERLAAIDEAGQAILNYCHIREIPPGLKYTLANMAVDLLRYEQAANNPVDSAAGGNDIAGAVSSVTEGDTTVKFGGKSPGAADRDRALDSHKAVLDGLLMDYKAQLQAFRRVAWL